MTSPQFSVVIPTYGRPHLVGRALKSVLSQSVSELEVLVCLDGPSADTEAAVRQATHGDTRVRMITVPHAGHPSPARDAGCASAQAPIIAYLDDDDIWRPDHLATMTTLFRQGAEVAATAYVRLDSAGQVTEQCPGIRMCWHPELQAMGALFQPACVAHHNGLARSVGGWQVGTGFEDWDLWQRLAEAGHRFLTSTKTTVESLDTQDSRRYTLAFRERTTVATFHSGRDAARAKKQIEDEGTSPIAVQAHLEDTVVWYDAMERSGDLRYPVDWIGPRLDANAVKAMYGDAVIPGPPWIQRLLMAPAEHGCALVIAQMTNRTSHTDRVDQLTAMRLPRQFAWACDIAESHGAMATFADAIVAA